ncbi:MAG: tyrosine-type recombinase/integrase [Burkholderiales bacterium]|nr:tyrosine-type recombinase/integrase [Burkholderiales bacterium]
MKPLAVHKARDDGLLADGGGLYLCVRGASATWLMRYTAADGRRREMGLGTAERSTIALSAESLARARRDAADARDLIRKGKDPIAERKATKQANAAEAAAKKAAAKVVELTLLRAARGYHERVVEPARTTKHAAQWIASIEGPAADEPRPAWRRKLDALLPRPVGSITGPELLDAIADMQAAVSETAARVRQRLEAIFDDAEFRGMCSGNPARAIRRKLRETKRGRDRGQFAALPYVEAPAFMRELRQREGIAARALEFAVLTAARTGEVIGATWDEIDLQAGAWTVGARRMKGGEQHTVHLVPRAVEILQAQAALGSAYVFPSAESVGKETAAPMSNMAMLALLRRMDADKRTTVHGLCRATFSTWAYETAAARPDVIEACLAHREGDRVKAAYNRARFNAERRALLQAWADFLDGTREAGVQPCRRLSG